MSETYSYVLPYELIQTSKAKRPGNIIIFIITCIIITPCYNMTWPNRRIFAPFNGQRLEWK
jgi:hypothetical protein